MQSLCGGSLGLLMGSAFTEPKMAVALMSMLLMPLMMFTGLHANLDSIPVWSRWIQYISPFRYTYESFCRNEYKNTHYMLDVVSYFGFKIGLWQCVLLVIAITIVFRFAALFFLTILRKRL